MALLRNNHAISFVHDDLWSIIISNLDIETIKGDRFTICSNNVVKGSTSTTTLRSDRQAEEFALIRGASRDSHFDCSKGDLGSSIYCWSSTRLTSEIIRKWCRRNRCLYAEYFSQRSGSNAERSAVIVDLFNNSIDHFSYRLSRSICASGDSVRHSICHSALCDTKGKDISYGVVIIESELKAITGS